MPNNKQKSLQSLKAEVYTNNNKLKHKTNRQYPVVLSYQAIEKDVKEW